MTAIVGILNKHAVAVAADSAVTIGAGHKIYNTANKIFSLSKFNPVGVAIYSSANFNRHVPWEIIIKTYREQLDDRKFPTLEEYVSDFISYLSKMKNSYITNEEFKEALYYEIGEFWLNLESKSIESDTVNYKALMDNLTILLDKSLTTVRLPEFEEYSLEDFMEEINEILMDIVKDIPSELEYSKELLELFKKTCYEIFTRKISFNIRQEYTGIAFFGYGENEIYPSMQEIIVYNCINNKLLWNNKNIAKVDNTLDNSSFICPMAQTDEILTYITGIHPQIQEEFINLTEQTIKGTLDELKTIFLDDPRLREKYDKIDLTPIIKKYRIFLEDYKAKNKIHPLMQIVATKEKEDLAELAENLIYLTSLKRRITPNLESVGGPVDVVIVSKGDGLIWIKRKHYFDPDLNRCFFDKYYVNHSK